ATGQHGHAIPGRAGRPRPPGGDGELRVALTVGTTIGSGAVHRPSRHVVRTTLNRTSWQTDGESIHHHSENASSWLSYAQAVPSPTPPSPTGPEPVPAAVFDEMLRVARALLAMRHPLDAEIA